MKAYLMARNRVAHHAGHAEARVRRTESSRETPNDGDSHRITLTHTLTDIGAHDMGASRTSNKDILTAIENLTAAILATQVQAPVQAAPVVTPTVETPAPAESQSIDIPKGYMEHMNVKVAELTANDGQARVLYARRNGHGETKLAYCLKSRWDAGLKDRGLIGAVKVYAS